jgi:DNA-directed RNA polymerase subunit RPC12/RpoP
MSLSDKYRCVSCREWFDRIDVTEYTRTNFGSLVTLYICKECGNELAREIMDDWNIAKY